MTGDRHARGMAHRRSMASVSVTRVRRFFEIAFDPIALRNHCRSTAVQLRVPSRTA
ncbi:hypothetical protein [Luteimonas deserti]|uniref:Uncharacterized protein n=1 Tax=Luteimonas deserti TaxID=2752306 RepID=A0A7Z0TZ72_9GAMM|nr:hypothetical protein [Luteimonas deserti]NYZ61928.1 hypothetical protein [Luteimonas deserti]